MNFDTVGEVHITNVPNYKTFSFAAKNQLMCGQLVANKTVCQLTTLVI